MAKKTAKTVVKKVVKKAVKKAVRKPAVPVKKAAAKAAVTKKPAVAKKPAVPAKKPVPPVKTAAVKKPVVPQKKAAPTAKKPVVEIKKPVIAAVKPAAVAKPAADKNLTAAEVAVFKEKLLAMRERLCGNVVSMTDAALNKNRMEASGDVPSPAPIHSAEAGTDNYEQEHTLTLAQSVGETIELIDDALERIKDGTYGICEECECRIPKGRLQVYPYALMCVKCAEIAEQNEW
ncbi:MAG: TraR/DksA family transcriptional regulator [Planctomycetaceae bacterium]|jgi:RNA polymerase-binding transcription factor DksA|nr:TraR/DksA family transcriptional regulator [Planctomycetaceae bacterium]